MTYKKRFFLIPAILVILILIGIAYFTGHGPIPASVGLALTDEIEMSVKDIAYATAAAENCNKQNYSVNMSVLVAAKAKLNDSQKANFETIKAETLTLISENPDSPKRVAKNCKSLDRDFQRISGKKIIISN